ncbi:hypothetical protein KW114_03275 [Methylococcus capsulatus]|nr:hypothetical protein KW114_03275 [Methylococcus capsulatus]
MPWAPDWTARSPRIFTPLNPEDRRMEQVTNALTTALAAVFLSAMIIEVRRRQKQLQELYNVLDEQDRLIVMELDRMVELGEIKPYAD